MSWFDSILQHENVATALITVSGTIVVTVLGKVFGFWSFVGKQLEISFDRRRKRFDAEPRPPKKTMIITEDLSIVPPNLWQIDQYDAAGLATGFRVLLVLTCLVPRVKVTAATARLPFRYRKHRVLHAIFQRHQKLIDLPDAMTGMNEASLNFYVRPQIVSKKPVIATIRLRDQFSNWHEHKVTFHDVGVDSGSE